MTPDKEIEEAAEAWAQEHGMGANTGEPRSISVLCAEEVAFEAGAEWERARQEEWVEELIRSTEGLLQSAMNQLELHPKHTVASLDVMRTRLKDALTRWEEKCENPRYSLPVKK